MKKHELKSESERKRVSPEVNREYVEKLSKMISCKTVWTKGVENQAEFDRFYSLLPELFPNIAKTAKRLTFGGGCFVYVIEGKNAKKNIMLMSHHDVVDGDDRWGTNPFEATERDGYLYGRGTIDTKTPLFAELQACEELLAEGYDFEGVNVYIGSSNNEEVAGDGMVLATEYFKKEGIRFDVVLDEGGAITEGQIPGVSCKSAVVAVHEKSRHYFKCKLDSSQIGHGGFGKSADSAAENMSRFISEVKSAKIYKGDFYPEVRATFERHAPYMSFPLNLLFGNITVFAPIIKKIMMGIPAASAQAKYHNQRKRQCDQFFHRLSLLHFCQHFYIFFCQLLCCATSISGDLRLVAHNIITILSGHVSIKIQRAGNNKRHGIR